jgi:DNA-binding winged helix-turn-helix (wHTH) protein
MSLAPSLLEKMESALREARIVIEERDAEIANLRQQLGGVARERMLDRLWRFGLTLQEAAMFAILYDAKGRTLSKWDLEEALPGRDDVSERAIKIVDVIICKLRRKLGLAGIVETVWGRGYRLSKAGLELGDAIANDEPVQIIPRIPHGSKRVLSDDQAREIKVIGYAETARVIAARYGCSDAVIHAIRKGYRYGNVQAVSA